MEGFLLKSKICTFCATPQGMKTAGHVTVGRLIVPEAGVLLTWTTGHILYEHSDSMHWTDEEVVCSVEISEKFLVSLKSHQNSQNVLLRHLVSLKTQITPKS